MYPPFSSIPPLPVVLYAFGEVRRMFARGAGSVGARFRAVSQRSAAQAPCPGCPG